MKKTNWIFLMIFLGLPLFSSGQNTDFSVFQVSKSKTQQWIKYKNNNQLLYQAIMNEAFRQLKERQERISQLEDKNDWEQYREKLRSTFFSSLNKFKKTPLNARITGVIRMDSYRVEKVLFESHPVNALGETKTVSIDNKEIINFFERGK